MSALACECGRRLEANDDEREHGVEWLKVRRLFTRAREKRRSIGTGRSHFCRKTLAQYGADRCGRTRRLATGGKVGSGHVKASEDMSQRCTAHRASRISSAVRKPLSPTTLP